MTLRRVGHKGADHLAPGNTASSFDAAVAVGVDMIEFDVLPAADGRLVLAHDPEDAAAREPLTLAEGLEYLAGDAFAGIDFVVDLKAGGYERAVLDALRDHGLLERSLVSTQHARSLAVLRAHAPEIRLGWSVPRLRHDPFRSRVTAVPAWFGLQAMRAGLPGRAANALSRNWCTAIMAHWLLVTGSLLRRVRESGGELYVWTVDDAERIRSLAALGATGVITNDPRLFAALADAPAAAPAPAPRYGKTQTAAE